MVSFTLTLWQLMIELEKPFAASFWSGVKVGHVDEVDARLEWPHVVRGKLFFSSRSPRYALNCAIFAPGLLAVDVDVVHRDVVDTRRELLGLDGCEVQDLLEITLAGSFVYASLPVILMSTRGQRPLHRRIVGGMALTSARSVSAYLVVRNPPAAFAGDGIERDRRCLGGAAPGSDEPGVLPTALLPSTFTSSIDV